MALHGAIPSVSLFLSPVISCFALRKETPAMQDVAQEEWVPLRREPRAEAFRSIDPDVLTLVYIMIRSMNEICCHLLLLLPLLVALLSRLRLDTRTPTSAPANAAAFVATTTTTTAAAATATTTVD